MKIDLLSQHSIFCYYPYWLYNLNKHRSVFNKVILYPSDHNREVSFKDFLFENIKETWVKDHVIDWTAPGVDWRQAETEPMLPLVEGDWVYFNEPDWIVRDFGKFYSVVLKAMEDGADAVGWMNLTQFPYLHPASFFIKREVLEKTQKDFRAHPEIPGCDHFAMLTRDLENMGAKVVTYQGLGLNCNVEPTADCFHLGGLTSNIIDSVVNPDFQFHRPEIFHTYNFYSRKLINDKKVPYSQEYYDLSLKVDNVLIKNHPEVVFAPSPSPTWIPFFDL